MAIIIVAGEHDIESYRSLSSIIRNVRICNLKVARDLIGQFHFNLGLLDCGFEIDKGLELLKELKAAHSSIPFILITSVSSEDIVLRAFKVGARDFFKKPLNILELQATITGMLAAMKTSTETFAFSGLSRLSTWGACFRRHTSPIPFPIYLKLSTTLKKT